MLLPVRYVIDFPLVPPMGKHALPALTVLAATLFFASLSRGTPQQPGMLPKNWIALGLLALLIFGAIGTAVTNTDRIVTPLEVKQGLRLYDGLSMGINYAILVLPILIGRKFFATPEAHRLILIVFCVAACLYAFLALYEIRMSPQLNRNIYGFTPHSWRQHVRGGGFRPMVFLEHGLRVSLFFALALIATLGLLRIGWKPGWMIAATGWLALTLALSKSLGAIMIALAVAPLVFLLSRRLLIGAAAAIAFTVLLFPMVRGSGVIPIDSVITLASSIDEDRARSFNTRLENEEILLERAAERPVFGWGGFGRSRVRNEKGIDIVIPDGYWVIIIGVGGWSRYVGEFGLMAVPMLLLFLQRRRVNVSRETAILSAILAANMIDLIPNSGQTPITWLIAGALWGRLENRGSSNDSADQSDESASPNDPKRPSYARDFGQGKHKRPSPSKSAPPRKSMPPKPTSHARQSVSKRQHAP
ncbi:MAG: hypothetical protein AAGL89_10675 [Pseudomonadota bacterium]